MSMDFKRVLVANRGEIAVRIIKTLRDLGYESVAVFSDADADAPFVSMADRAVPLGDPLVSRSYLDGEKIIRAAKASGADAVHPGYGFLSENALFAERCMESELTFIGPRPHSIRTMGDKRQAKEQMVAAGVPCVPGHLGDQDENEFAAAATAIGFPVIVKAAAGGGGRGMRLVRSLDELCGNLRAARSEAQNAFGDGSLYLEKLVEHGRHIEIQIVADQHGSIVHLGERDCSVQRRFQKVVEEAPSPFVDAELRKQMGDAAILAAGTVDYMGVGTVEFLVDDNRNFYFIEMNTRLQVEHPVTELVTGLDLVELQLRIAAGEKLPFAQDEIRIEGHALEARLYAEDARNNYLPQTGQILYWRPSKLQGVRIDSGVAEGMELTSHYDALIAKIIAYGPTRTSARRRLVSALRATPLLGLATNRGLLLDICSHSDFAAGAATTSFLQTANFPERMHPSRPLCVAAAILHGWPASYDLASWLRAGPADWALDVGGTRIGIRRKRSGVVSATINSETVEVKPLGLEDGKLRCQIGEVVFNFAYVLTSNLIEVDFEGERIAVTRFARHEGNAPTGGEGGAVNAPINGRIIKIDVESGQLVTRGDTLVVIEAMKMEMALTAPIDGIVGLIVVQVGDQVQARQEILTVNPKEREEA